MEKANKQLNTDATDDIAIADGQQNNAERNDNPDLTDKVEQTAERAYASQMQVAESNPSGSSPATALTTKRKISKTIDILLWILVAVLAILVLVRAFVYTGITVSGKSMYPTYDNEQVVNVSKVSTPKRGDVVVFYTKPVNSKFLAMFASRKQSEAGGKYEKYIKRLVALPGDKLWLEQVQSGVYQLVIQAPDGTVYHEDYYEHNGDKLPVERFLLYTNASSQLGCLKDHTQDNPLIISNGCFFAMGDNRGDSYDSRSFGEVPLDRLYGVVIQSNK